MNDNNKKLVRETRQNYIFTGGSRIPRTPTNTELNNTLENRDNHSNTLHRVLDKFLEVEGNRNLEIGNEEDIQETVDKNLTGVELIEDLNSSVSGNSEEDFFEEAKLELDNLNMAQFDYADFNKRIPEFSGEKGLGQVFAKRCEIYHDSLDIAGKALFFQNLVFKLQGEPFSLYNRSANWNEFKKALITESRNITSYQSLSEKMRHLKQGGGTVRDFANSIYHILEDLDYVISLTHDSEEVREGFRIECRSTAMRTFKEGLKEPLKGRVVSNGSKNTLDEIVRFALEEEPFTKTVKFNMESNLNFNKNGNDFSYDKELRNIKEVRCFHCGRLGHTTKRCYVNRSNIQNYQDQSDLKCYRCEKIGHLAKNCYARLTIQKDLPKREMNIFQIKDRRNIDVHELRKETNRQPN